MERGKVIGSVNFLDLRRATEESIQAYESVGSANIVLVSPGTRHLLHQLKIGGINATAEVADDINFELIMGPLKIDSGFFASVPGPLGFLVMGPLTVSPDVSPDDLERGLSALVVMGPIRAPAPLAGVLQSKTKLVMGPVSSYPVYEAIHKGDLVLDRTYLESLPAGTEMTVVGSVTVPDGISDGLIRKKLAKLYATGNVTCFEVNAAEMQAALSDTSSTLRIVPTGFKIVERAVRVDRNLLESITDRKLYFVHSVEIDPDVDANLFAQKIDGIGCRGMLIAPVALQASIAKACDLLNTTTLFYEGTLWRIDGESTLLPSRFDYLDAKATLIVTGALKIDPAVSPDVLASRLAKVHLTGVIECSPEHQSALESRIGITDGAFERYWDEEEAAQEADIGSANYLAL